VTAVTAEAVADLLQARPNASGWMARCPAHEDRSPSLSIGTGRDGRTLLNCFGGCSLEAVCAALKISVSDLFPTPGALTAKPRAVREAEDAIRDLRSRLTPRERTLEVTVILCPREDLDAAIARGLALAVEGEIVQVAFEGQR
jgi:hypothetical protein